MNPSDLLAHFRERLDKRRRYNRLCSEIKSMSHRDFVDVNASQDEMLRGVYRQVYG